MIKQWMTAFLNLIPERFQSLVLGVLAAIIVILCLLIIIVLLKRIRSIRWQDQRQNQTLHLRNNGNLDLRFRLQAFSFQPGLELSLSRQGQPLPMIQIPLGHPATSAACLIAATSPCRRPSLPPAPPGRCRRWPRLKQAT